MKDSDFVGLDSFEPCSDGKKYAPPMLKAEDTVGAIKSFSNALAMVIVNSFSEDSERRQKLMSMEKTPSELIDKVSYNFMTGFFKIYRTHLNDSFGKLVAKKNPHSALAWAKQAALLIVTDHFEDSFYNFQQGILKASDVLDSALNEFEQEINYRKAQEAEKANKIPAKKK